MILTTRMQSRLVQSMPNFQCHWSGDHDVTDFTFILDLIIWFQNKMDYNTYWLKIVADENKHFCFTIRRVAIKVRKRMANQNWLRCDIPRSKCTSQTRENWTFIVFTIMSAQDTARVAKCYWPSSKPEIF